MAVSFAVDEGDLVVRDDASVVWRGRPDGFRVIHALQVPATQDAVVLLDYDAAERPARFANVARVTAVGSPLWRADPPAVVDVKGEEASLVEGDDSWVAIRWERDRGLTANSWSGFYCALDPHTGRITSAEFTK